MGDPPEPEAPHGYDASPPAEARLGVSARETARGLEIVEVREGSLAQTLGLAAGDVLLELNGRSVHRPSDVASALAGAGSAVKVRFERDGATHVVTLDH
jgi:S1-C subfamily serine protease